MGLKDLLWRSILTNENVFGGCGVDCDDGRRGRDDLIRWDLMGECLGLERVNFGGHKLVKNVGKFSKNIFKKNIKN